MNVRRMIGVRWDTVTLALCTASMLTVGQCTAFLFMSKHLQYLLVLRLQYACNLLLQ